MNRPALVALVFATTAALAAAGRAQAMCFPGITPDRYVGNTATDAQCTDDTIQSAIDNATCPGTVIHITQEHLYTHQHLSLANKSLTLVGEADGVGCGPPVACDPDLGCGGGGGPVTQPRVTLDGSGDGGRVLSISGSSNVTLRYLNVTGGDLDGPLHGDGGGIDFEGSGSLALDTSTVQNNRADDGGGIHVAGFGDANHPAILRLGSHALILGNHAGASGGGIDMRGNAVLLALQPDTLIFNNDAPNGDGGGIAVTDGARAYIGSPGYGGLGVVELNDAENGGGIAVVNNVGASCAQLFTTDPRHPVAVSNNSATGLGGAIYVAGASTQTGIDSHLELIDFRIDGNVAADGAAIYGTGPGSLISLSHSGINPPPPTCFASDDSILYVQQLSVACAQGLICSEMSGNGNRDPLGDPTGGASIALSHFGNLQARGVQMRNNEGGNLVAAEYASFSSSLYDLLLADNSTSGALIWLDQMPANVAIHDATIANNTIENHIVIRVGTGSGLGLTTSIIDQPGDTSVDAQGAKLVVASSILATETASLPAGSAEEGEPGFLDAPHGDYHLRPDSLGVDYAPGSGIADLDGRNRQVDLPQIPNQSGPQDLGAYERQSAFACDDHADAVFCNGFEP